MECRTCGASIAEKAIACYRCGAATAMPAVARPTRASATKPWLLVVLAVCIAAVLGWLAVSSPAGSMSQIAFAALGAVAASVGGWFARPGGRR